MNHAEEMKMLTALQKIQKNTERIAIALEKLVKLNEETQVVTVLDPGFPDGKPPMYDCEVCCNTCANAPEMPTDESQEAWPTCRYFPDCVRHGNDKWEAKK